jgi:hypothetical protein
MTLYDDDLPAEAIDATYPRVGMALFVYINLICVNREVWNTAGTLDCRPWACNSSWAVRGRNMQKATSPARKPSQPHHPAIPYPSQILRSQGSPGPSQHPPADLSGRQDSNLRPPGPQPDQSGVAERSGHVFTGFESLWVLLSCAHIGPQIGPQNLASDHSPQSRSHVPLLPVGRRDDGSRLQFEMPRRDDLQKRRWRRIGERQNLASEVEFPASLEYRDARVAIQT